MNRLITTALAFGLTAASAVVAAGELKPFSTDGCSLFPEGLRENQELWLECCVEHDKAYWLGGTYNERREADLALRECVTEIGQPEIAEIMLGGVRVGGSPYWPTTYRWGYGWSAPRGYRPVSDEERQLAEQLLRGLDEPASSAGN